MKKLLKVMGAIAIVAMAGLAFFACGDASEPAYSHTWGEWEETTPATYVVEGMERRVCTREGCEGYETREIPRRRLAVARISAGEFTMGSPDDEAERSTGEGPQREVTLTRGFYMGIHEVTRLQWYEVMGSTLEEHREASGFATSPEWGQGANYPMHSVNWYEAVYFANELSRLAGLTPAYTITEIVRVEEGGTAISSAVVEWNREANGYRLPTEAEWEYAARAGTTTPWYWSDIQDRARFSGSPSEGAPAEGAMEVGSFEANAWGLYDMHGNVWEWVWDWYDTYEGAETTDPLGASSGRSRVERGGSWRAAARLLRSAHRRSGNPFLRGDNLGFRLVRP